jgi:hypothetical protein
MATPYYSLEVFDTTDTNQILENLSSYQLSSLREEVHESQRRSWKQSFQLIKNNYHRLKSKIPNSKNWYLILEYQLPRERGRRPDFVILTDRGIIIIEFKGYPQLKNEDLDQVASYVRDISNYQSYSHNKIVNGILFLGTSTSNKEIDEIRITGPDHLVETINDAYINLNGPTEINPDAFISSEYAPLPSLIEAARNIFNNEPLPQIRKAQSAGIPETLDKLIGITKKAEELKEHVLVLVTGVPGAGKTLVGLQYVYHDHFNNPGKPNSSIFLSGNGPLVNVLQYALKSNVFVRDVHGFLKDYGGTPKYAPYENIYVYDEAQRAWDSEKVMEKRGHNNSEPDDFINIGSNKSWAVMIGLIGEGQEIFSGEESGLKQWNDAIAKSKIKWNVACAEHVSNFFNAAYKLEKLEMLHLDHSLRSHIAEDVKNWVENFLIGRVEFAVELNKKISSEGFSLYVTRDLNGAKEYVRNRYKDSVDKRFGLLASSKADKILNEFGFKCDYMSTQQLSRKDKLAKWFMDHPDSIDSCCALNQALTEFQCQGLELDLPIVGWADDLIRQKGNWKTVSKRGKGVKDPYKLTMNSYRVLLTRGRDGMILFIPEKEALDETYEFLINSGVRNLNHVLN